MSLPETDPVTCKSPPLKTSIKHWLFPEHLTAPLILVVAPLRRATAHVSAVHDTLPDTAREALAATEITHADPEHVADGIASTMDAADNETTVDVAVSVPVDIICSASALRS